MDSLRHSNTNIQKQTNKQIYIYKQTNKLADCLWQALYFGDLCLCLYLCLCFYLCLFLCFCFSLCNYCNSCGQLRFGYWWESRLWSVFHHSHTSHVPCPSGKNYPDPPDDDDADDGADADADDDVKAHFGKVWPLEGGLRLPQLPLWFKQWRVCPQIFSRDCLAHVRFDDNCKP